MGCVETLCRLSNGRGEGSLTKRWSVSKRFDSRSDDADGCGSMPVLQEGASKIDTVDQDVEECRWWRQGGMDARVNEVKVLW